MVQLCIIEYTYIGNIIGILLCCNLHHYYCILTYTHTHIYRKSWLTNRLSLLIILNLVLEPSAIRTLSSLSLWTLLLLPPSPPHHTGGAAQLASQSKAIADGSFSHQQQPSPTKQHHCSFSHVYVVPLHMMGTSTTFIIALSNTQQVVSLKLTNTNYLYWRMQMKPYLLSQGVFCFVDGSMSCPPSHVFYSSDGSSSAINPSFLHWKQQDQLILNTLLPSLSINVLHLMVECQTSSCIWRTLEKMLASPSNSRIIQLHGSFQDLRQGDASVAQYVQHTKSLFDELVAVG